MLIETPYKNGDTVSIKLSSGEELIARLEEETSDGFSLNKPLMVVAGQQGLGLAPFMFTVDPSAKFKVKSQNVVCIVKTATEMSKQYIQNTTGIIS